MIFALKIAKKVLRGHRPGPPDFSLKENLKELSLYRAVSKKRAGFCFEII